MVNKPLFFASISDYWSVNSGIYPSATFVGRRFLNPIVVYRIGFAKMRFRAENNVINVDIVFTLTAVEPDAKMLSIDDKSGTTPIFSTRLPLQFKGPVKGYVCAYSLIGFSV